MVTSIMGSALKPVSSYKLKEYFDSREDLEGILYIGYPIIGTSEGAYPIDAIWLSKEKGVVIFCLIEGKKIENYTDVQDDSCNKVEARLRIHKELMLKRTLAVSVNVITFAPAVVNSNPVEGYPLCNSDDLGDAIDAIEDWETPEYFDKLVSVIQSVSTIRKNRKKREIKNSESRGAKLVRIEDSIATLDNSQGRAVIESVDGVQRIRGLAGSGKTIVLALKAAYLHAQHPDWKIAVTFNTRSLKEQLIRWITSFYAEHTNAEPDWDNLRIVHAWGSRSTDGGIYYDFCLKHNVEWMDWRSAKEKTQTGNPFEMVCEKALKEATQFFEMYDAILVDEAQDLPVCFLRLCYAILSKPKRLVYAYDELQSLNLQSLPSPEEIFGADDNGNPKVKFAYDSFGKSKQDIILEKCYRNSRQALTIAHALGFGLYRKSPQYISDTGIVQMFEQHSLWEDVGYKVVGGELRDGERVVLERTEESSPSFLETHSTADDLFMCKLFSSVEEQDKWVANEIVKNIRDEELRPDDIIVINPDPLSTRERVGRIRSLLNKEGIDSHIAGVDCSPDVFFETNKASVTFTGIYRAKGNEAAMVYVINSNDCYGESDWLPTSSVAILRNRLFTAITRSKAWVRLVGVGAEMKLLMDEIEKVRKHNYQLEFIYPTAEQRKRMNILNRDMSLEEKNKVLINRKNFKSILSDLDSGNLFLEDLGEADVEKLRRLLNAGDR